jgi:hypothetical protein
LYRDLVVAAAVVVVAVAVAVVSFVSLGQANVPTDDTTVEGI